MEHSFPPLSETGNDAGCKSCGALLKFAPGTNSLQCEYCGYENEIQALEEHSSVEELDFHSHLSQEGVASSETLSLSTVICVSCGAESTLKPNVTADECAFCGTALVLKQAHITTLLKPKSVLPFSVDKKKADEHYKKWLKSLWFAPNDLHRYATPEKLKGMYLPYWTYDTDTTTEYRGERGMNRSHTEHYTEMQNGQQVSKSRTVTVTDWFPTGGEVQKHFDDIIINASNSLPRNFVDALEPWDTKSIVPFNENYLAGFISESYQIGLKEGFDMAKVKIEPIIDQVIRADIGGDHQRIHSKFPVYDDITFKHTLFPLWLSSFRYKDKAFRFLINARTGKIKGDRPYSVWKIIGASFFGILSLLSFGIDPIFGVVAVVLYLVALFKLFK